MKYIYTDLFTLRTPFSLVSPSCFLYELWWHPWVLLFGKLINQFLKFIFGCTGFSFPCTAFSSCRAQASLYCLFCGRVWAPGYTGFSNSGMWTLWLWRMGCIQNLSRPEIEPMSPALAGGFLTTGQPRKSTVGFFGHRSSAQL